jgi:carboxyl-terminal processing protease
VLWTACILPPALAVSTGPLPTTKLKELQDQAEKAQASGQWARACDLYEEILRQDRGQTRVRQRFQTCYRRFQQFCRLRDRTYQKEVLNLPYSQAVQLYEAILGALQSYHVDKARAAPTALFRRGLEELRFALQDDWFLATYVPQLSPRDARAFLGKMSQKWGRKVLRNMAQAVEQVRDVAMTAQKPVSAGGLDLNATIVVAEFACGACTALDEYTFYLTPGQYSTASAALSGKAFVGVGIELCLRDGQLIIARVLRGSPADKKGLKAEDQVTRIGGKFTADLTPETAMDLLKGDEGTVVELGISSGGVERWPVPLERRRLIPRSVESGWLTQKTDMPMETDKPEIGYVQISHFQKSTPQELDNALMYLKEGGLKALVVDLRGNRGGSFEAAVESARRFLASGVIVSTRNQQARVNKWVARGGGMIVPLPKEIPVVVLVDGDTASAAEVLAGALKDNGRARLVGQTTFGKGCTQRFLQLTAVRGGSSVGAIRITVARFFSPNGDPYTGRGITPHIPAERHLDPNRMDDHQLFEARSEAQRLVRDQMAMNMN